MKGCGAYVPFNFDPKERRIHPPMMLIVHWLSEIGAILCALTGVVIVLARLISAITHCELKLVAMLDLAFEVKKAWKKLKDDKRKNRQ
ncbi:hypothetical protein [Ligilactobacillus salivarius]|uniref:hypothetical protein n=2 Tax=Ligilactobacillus salivarius TaxID=1624 RepID=UPI0001DD32B3|nr:hypothetical protein [Ligilactobacillus salivarius]EFK79963.1 hypothetical protein HMPREF9269_0187 [Ligilactobacillus salivarius ACS-116-V-Col5a]